MYLSQIEPFHFYIPYFFHVDLYLKEKQTDTENDISRDIATCNLCL